MYSKLVKDRRKVTGREELVRSAGQKPNESPDRPSADAGAAACDVNRGADEPLLLVLKKLSVRESVCCGMWRKGISSTFPPHVTPLYLTNQT